MADSVLQGDGSKLVLTQSLKNAKTQKENLQVILFQREIIKRKAPGIPSRTPQNRVGFYLAAPLTEIFRY